ncbi:TetR family transcriptional regulator [Actinocrispum wychmicini]|uniref:TetR family transcriptional regulator n=1 Tax=Actinocrispum wychmicini TaxID=1213861 RepID=A0A4R2J0V4_9PSEU|nr:TetR family transcriptional regulator [Actinocrispum wychmicini]TCO49899.1 TetR family transcriptional regulator [Actinocrispum wychmicini]
MAGLRERKKELTKRRIAVVALKLFTERGFEAVTVNEIAETAEVAKATLFTYFPSKESLVLEGVGDDDLAGIVARRAPDQTPLQALRTHFRTFAAVHTGAIDWDDVVGRTRVIIASPLLSAAANTLLYQQRQALAEVLAEDHGPRAATLMAAQIAATVLTLQESFFHLLTGGTSPEQATGALAQDIELAFDLLEHGIDHTKGK